MASYEIETTFIAARELLEAELVHTPSRLARVCSDAQSLGCSIDYTFAPSVVTVIALQCAALHKHLIAEYLVSSRFAMHREGELSSPAHNFEHNESLASNSTSPPPSTSPSTSRSDSVLPLSRTLAVCSPKERLQKITKERAREREGVDAGECMRKLEDVNTILARAP